MGTRELDAVIREVEAIADEVGSSLVVDLVSIIGGEFRVEPEVRGSLVPFARRRLVRCSAIVGGPRRARVLIQLLVNAIQLGAPNTTKTKFCDTEAEALAWLESL